MSHTFFVKFRVFKREFLRNHWYVELNAVFSRFVLLAPQDSDKNMLMKQKMQTMIRPY